MKGSWYNKKWLTGFFAVISLVAGFLFLDQSTTGNVVITEGTGTAFFNPLSLVGLLLVLASAVLAMYAIKS